MLYDLYKELVPSAPDEEGEILGFPLDDERSGWITVDLNDHPALMLPARPDDLRTDIVLRAVDVEFSRTCTIESLDESKHTGCYTIIRLKEDDPDIVRLFLRILEERFLGKPYRKANSGIAESIQEIASLFSRTSLASRDVIGLWGELFAIYQATDLELAIRAWSLKKNAKYDFVAGDFVLDVKAALSHVPKHRFSLEQLRPSGDFRAFVLSLCLVEQQGGKTVGELMDTIANRISDADLGEAFLRNCLVKGGREIYGSELRLQPYPHPDSFKVFDAAELPVASTADGDVISNIRFDMDLSSAMPLDRELSATILKFK